ncbi:MAG: phenylalanine--tRNA ligase subunit beta [Christensenellaceae bacterium]|jgi:phenylalanyl-tRNA synthetase beta chain|nr:phenylalanine--tRNA ligase subunit beta [Christensenellaceae bacterium]
MLVSLNWLKNYVDLEGLSPEAFEKKMIAAGNAIEESRNLGDEVQRVVVGRILKMERHPNSDHLWICQVDVGSETIQIVTGAQNMREGDLVPTALDNSLLPGGVRIKKGKLRGENSNGMMCSGEELGVPPEVYPSNAERGLLILNGEHAPGEDIRPILGLDDVLFDFEILANRPDCLSILGLAHEAAAVTGRASKAPEVKVSGSGGSIHERVKIRVEDETLCPRYAARVVRGIKIEPSPLWMRLRLHASGIRPINNIVDITNYVMLELGQPMHAFDLGSVRGAQIIVRRAKKGEGIRTLDGKDRALTGNMLVIADAEGATGLAGVMGGEGSEITEGTKEVLFESACFDGASIRQTGRALGLRTEAQGRFERGVNPGITLFALERAVQLVEELQAGEVVDGLIDLYPNPVKIQPIEVKIGYLQTLMGIAVPPDEMKAILERLQIRTEIKGDSLYCLPPAHRQDLRIGADIAEEVLRLYGYDQIPTTLMRGETKAGGEGKTLARAAELRAMLVGMGAFESVTFAFIAPRWYDLLGLPKDAPERQSARLQNPLGEEYSVMRTTLIPSILQVLSLNMSRSVEEMLTFEMGSAYLPKALPLGEELPEQRPVLCIGLYGENADFYRVKGIAEALFGRFGIEKPAWKRACKSYLHPGRGAVAAKGELELATLGEIHPDAQEGFRLSKRVYVAEIDLINLDLCAQSLGAVKGAPRFPAVERDMALVVGEEVLVGDLLAAIEKAGGTLLEQAKLFDIYRGAPVPEGSKSVAVSITLRAPDRTLTEQEISKAVEDCLGAAKERFGAVLRA